MSLPFHLVANQAAPLEKPECHPDGIVSFRLVDGVRHVPRATFAECVEGIDDLPFAFGELFGGGHSC